jgi:hypothetical protein
MRSEKPADLLKLARALAASAEGMTLDEMADSRRSGAARSSGDATRSKMYSARSTGSKMHDKSGFG